MENIYTQPHSDIILCHQLMHTWYQSDGWNTHLLSWKGRSTFASKPANEDQHSNEQMQARRLFSACRRTVISKARRGARVRRLTKAARRSEGRRRTSPTCETTVLPETYADCTARWFVQQGSWSFNEYILPFITVLFTTCSWFNMMPDMFILHDRQLCQLLPEQCLQLKCRAFSFLFVTITNCCCLEIRWCHQRNLWGPKVFSSK